MDYKNTIFYIYNLQGQLIKFQLAKTGINTIDINDLSKGMYTIKIVDNNKIVVKKFIKD